jgi:hypothetical protein
MPENSQRNHNIENYILNYKKGVIIIHRWCRNMRDCIRNIWWKVLKWRRKKLNYRLKLRKSIAYKVGFVKSWDVLDILWLKTIEGRERYRLLEYLLS